MADQDNIYRVPAENVQSMKEQFARLVRKAKKLGAEKPQLVQVGESFRETENAAGVTSRQRLVHFSVQGAAPKLAGWVLVAVIEPLGEEAVTRVVPGETLPVEFRTVNMTCEHCNADRRRKEVFIVRHDDGRHARVGRNCLQDFLGGTSPEQLVAWHEFFVAAAAMGGEAERDTRFGQWRDYDLVELVTTAACVIRQLGWVSAAAAREEGREGTSTACQVLNILRPTPHTRQWVRENELYVNDADKALAAEAIEWGKAQKTDAGDYLYNVGVISRAGIVPQKNVGLAVSILSAYRRAMEDQVAKRMERETKARGFVGTIGAREGFAQVTIVGMREFDGEYGPRTLVRFEDAPGNIMVWWATGCGFNWNVGDVMDITATVKGHDVYKGSNQTTLQRVVSGLPKPKKQRKGKQHAV